MKECGRSTVRYLVLAALAAALAFAFQGSRGLYETTEGRYAEAAREMIETGSWLVPQLDYAPHWTKPPLAYWAIAGGMKLLGANEAGARFASAVAIVALVLAAARLAALLWGGAAGFAAGLVFAISPFPFAAGSSVQTDVILALWEILAVVCYREALRREGAGAARWISGMWLFMGLAFLTKGPPSLALLAALLVFQIYLARTGRRRARLFEPIGLVLFAAVGFGWFAVVVLRTPGLLDYFVREEIFGRIFTARHGRNPEWYMPFVIFVPPLLLGAGPALSAWFAAAARRAVPLGARSLARLLRESEKAAFLAIWLAVPLVIFSFVRSRLPLYVLPIFAPVAVATGRAAVLAFDSPRSVKRALAAAGATAVLLVALKGASAFYETPADMERLWKSARAEMQGKTGWYSYGSSDMFGLQFYLRGSLTRLADEPLPRWGRRGIDSLIGEMKTAPQKDTIIIVPASEGYEKALARKLEAAGVRMKLVKPPKARSFFVYYRSF